MVQIYIKVLGSLASLTFGVLILLFPRLLNYLVAAYFILMGLLGIIAAI